MKRFVFSFSLLTLAVIPFVLSCTKKKEVTEVKNEVNSSDLKSLMSDEAKALRDAVLSLDPRNTDGLDALIANYESGKTPVTKPDAAYFVSQLAVLRSLRSVVWKASGVFEEHLTGDKPFANLRNIVFNGNGIVPNDRQTEASRRIGHNAAFTVFRGAASGLAVFLPQSPSELAFRYVIEPSERNTQKYDLISELQADVYIRLIKNPKTGAPGTLTKLIGTMEGMVGSVSDASPIVWDNRMAFGKDSFKGEGAETFERIGGLEFKAALATAHMAMHDLLVFMAYDLNGAPVLFDRIQRRFGVDGVLSGQINGLPAQDFLADLSPTPNEAFKSLFTLNSEVNQKEGLLTNAYKHLSTAVKLGKEVFEGTKGGRSVSRGVFVSERLAPWINQTEQTVKNIEALVSGPTTLRSGITGEMAQFNLKAFYENPPQDLKSLLPVDFDKSEGLISSNQHGQYRNYWYGRPVGWSYNSYKPYVPSAGDAAGVERAARVASHSIGGGLNNVPLFAEIAGNTQ
jgi:hypothetical protein